MHGAHTSPNHWVDVARSAIFVVCGIKSVFPDVASSYPDLRPGVIAAAAGLPAGKARRVCAMDRVSPPVISL
jgi:hypothetical protein